MGHTVSMRRYLVAETRAAKDSAPGTVEAYASVFGTEYDIGPSHRESIAPGAFADSLKARNGALPVYAEHGWQNGQTPIGVAQAQEDDKGLRVEANLFVDDDSRARSIYRTLKAGAGGQWSIGFTPTEVEQSEKDGVLTERVTAADVLEVSSVLKGANPDTETLVVRTGPCPYCSVEPNVTKRDAEPGELETDLSTEDIIRLLSDPDRRATIRESF